MPQPPRHRLSERARLALSLAAVVGLAACIQAGVVARAIVPAQDAIRFAAEAQRIRQFGLTTFVRSQSSPPVFPTLVAAVDRGLSAVGGARPDRWARAVQLTGAGSLVLAVAPVFLSGWRIGGLGAGWCAAGMFLTLPDVARLGGDGLGDATQLLLLAVAWWCVVESFATGGSTTRQPRSVLWLTAAGLAVSLGVLTRTESLVGLVALGIAGLVYAVRPTFGPQRSSAPSGPSRWTPLAACGLGVALVAVPFGAWAKVDSPSQARDRLLGRDDADPQAGEFSSHVTLVVGDVRPMSLATTPGMLAATDEALALKDSGPSSRVLGWRAALVGIAEELARLLCLVWPVAIAWGYADARAGSWRPLVIATIGCVALYLVCAAAVAAERGYLTSRHLAPLVVPLAGWAGLGLARAIVGLAHQPHGSGTRAARAGLALGCGFSAVVGLIAVWRPLHPSHVAHRRAAAWLAAQTGGDPGSVLDTRAWTALYSGRPTYRYDAVRAAWADPRLGSLVCERGEFDRATPRGATLRRLVAERGARLRAFPGPSDAPERDVLVFTWGVRQQLAGESPPAAPPTAPPATDTGRLATTTR